MLCLPFFLLALAGCTSVSLPDRDYLAEQNVPSQHVIQSVPVIPQDDHYCGPAALATIAQFNGRSMPQDEAAEMVYTPGRRGTFQHDIVSAIQRSGLLAVPVNSPEELIEELASDHPAIIFQNLGLAWYPVWHYSVIAGYDLPESKLLVHGGTEEAQWKSFSTVGKTWKRTGYWGYIAVPVGSSTPTASEEELLQATAGLEAAGFQDKATQSYKTVLKTYPHSYGALFGLGNIAMTDKKYAAAENYYRRALKINPQHAYSLNNLTYSLAKQGKTKEGCAILSKHLADDTQEHSDELQNTYSELCE